MELLVYILCSILLFQDFKFRKVNLYVMIFLFFLNLFLGYSLIHNDIFILTGINVLLVLFLLLSLFIYYSIKNKKIYNITDQELGKGDIIMLLVLTPSFLSFNLMMFIILSIIVSILFALVVNIKSIPFAGIIALIYMAYTLLKQLNIIESFTPIKIENWI